MNKKLFMSRIFLVISIFLAIVFLVVNFYSQDIMNYLNFYRWIGCGAIVCNTINLLLKYLAFKKDGIEIKNW